MMIGLRIFELWRVEFSWCQSRGFEFCSLHWLWKSAEKHYTAANGINGPTFEKVVKAGMKSYPRTVKRYSSVGPKVPSALRPPNSTV